MRLRLTDEWRIESDPLCWILQKCHTPRKGGVEWRNKSYHTTLAEAVTHIAELSLRDSSAETLSQALAEVERLTRTLVERLSPTFEVTVK